MWTIKTTDTFDRWFASLNDTDRVSVLAALLVLREKGPGLTRPVPALCFVPEIRSAMKNVFTMRCSLLLTGNSRTG